MYPCVFESYMVILQRSVLSGSYNKMPAVEQGLLKKTLLEIDMNKVWKLAFIQFLLCSRIFNKY